MTTNIIALEKDLFFSVKIRDTLRHHDMDVAVVRNLSAFEARLTTSDLPHPELAIINISIQGVDWETAIRAALAQHIPVLAFGSHMDLDARAKALQAGARKVIANSKFASDMPALVQRMLNAPTNAPHEEDTGAEDASEK